MGFFPEGLKTVSFPPSSLEGVLYALKPETRKAIWVMSQSEVFEQRTWDGCVFNKVTGLSNSYNVASALGESEKAISDFICTWDAIPTTTTVANKILKDALQKVGLSVPSDIPKTQRVVRYYAYKSADTKFKEQLDNMTTLGDTELAELGLSVETVEAAKVLCNA